MITRVNRKQKIVYKILKERKPLAVLDIGANTGWYSTIANNPGAKVISLKVDISCSDIIFKKVEKDGLNILPLTVSFDDLTKEIFGMEYSDSIYNNRNFKKNPLYRSRYRKI